MAEFNFPGPPPKEAIAYFRAKRLTPSFDYRDVWREEHATQVTVAKAMQLDILQDIYDATDQALADGQTFAQFKRALKPRLVDKGWWGIQDMTDPDTGEIRQVQLGSTRRLKTIFRINMRTARAAGQWQRIQRSKSSHPYLLYELGPSRVHREEHVEWAGLLLPVDDPFWLTHFTPNGWGCKCRVRQVSQREYERLAATGQYKLTAPIIRKRPWLNKRTGEILQVPAGIDPGWDYNPGQVSRQALGLDSYDDQLNGVNAGLAAASIRSSLKSRAFAAWYEKPDGEYPVGLVSQDDADLIGAKIKTVRLSAETAVKQKDAHPEISAAEYAWVQTAIEQGQAIQDSGNSLVYLLQEPGYVSVIKATRTGNAIWLTSLRRLSSDQAKRDREIQRLLSRQIDGEG